MNIEQQIQALIDQAPQYGADAAEIRAVAPAFEAIARQLNHIQYYVLQTLDQSWLMTTLNHRTQSNLSKNVVYAYPSLKDAAAGSHALKDPQIVALPVPVIHILFQMLAMQPVDSIVFFETPGDLQSGTEVSRQNLEQLIQLHFQRAQGSVVPPDIA